MLNNVFGKTLRDLRGQILGWGIGLGAMTAITVLVYPSFQHMMELDGLVKSMPPAMQKLIGGQAALNVLDQFLNLKLFDSWLPIILSVFAIVRGAAAIAGEEENGTIDLLLANPVTRLRIILEKFAAIAFAVAAMTVLICLGLIVGVLVTGLEANLVRLVWATLNMIPLVLVFCAIALVGSCVFHRRRPAAAIAVVILVASYFLYVLGPLTDAVEPWLKLSLFHYYGKTSPIGQEAQTRPIMLLMGLIAVLVTSAAVAFQKKDLKI